MPTVINSLTGILREVYSRVTSSEDHVTQAYVSEQVRQTPPQTPLITETSSSPYMIYSPPIEQYYDEALEYYREYLLNGTKKKTKKKYTRYPEWL